MIKPISSNKVISLFYNIFHADKATCVEVLLFSKYLMLIHTLLGKHVIIETFYISFKSFIYCLYIFMNSRVNDSLFRHLSYHLSSPCCQQKYYNWYIWCFLYAPTLTKGTFRFTLVCPSVWNFLIFDKGGKVRASASNGHISSLILSKGPLQCNCDCFVYYFDNCIVIHFIVIN